MRVPVTCLVLLCACGSGGSADGGDACHDTSKSPANLLADPGFDCTAGTPSEWAGIYGAVTFPAEGRSGRAAKVVADAAGGRLGYASTVVTASKATTYCARAWVKGTAPFMRVSLTTASALFSSNDQLTSSWVQVPYAKATVQAGDTVSFMVEVQMSRNDGLNAKPGDTLYVDDADVWESSTGRCDER